MNDTPNSNPGEEQAGAQAHANADSSSQQSTRGPSAFECFRNAAREGAQQAKAAAEEAIPKIKAALTDASYWLGYGSSFAAVFSYTVLSELAPEVLKAGGRDGARDGRRAAEDVAARCKAPPAAAANEPPESAPVS